MTSTQVESTSAPSGLDHPLSGLRRKLRWTLGASSVAVMAAAIWGFWPLGLAEIELPPPPAPAKSSGPLEARSIAMLDLTAFGAPIWEPPPLPPPTPKPEITVAPLPPPPLKLQLLGIVRDKAGDGTTKYIAAIYDEVADKLLMLTDGDAIGPASAGRNTARVTRVKAESVELTDQSGSRVLALREPAKPIPGLKLITDAAPIKEQPSKPRRKQ